MERTVFQDLIKLFEVVHYDVSVFLEDGYSDEEMEVAG